MFVCKEIIVKNQTNQTIKSGIQLIYINAEKWNSDKANYIKEKSKMIQYMGVWFLLYIRSVLRKPVHPHNFVR